MFPFFFLLLGAEVDKYHAVYQNVACPKKLCILRYSDTIYQPRLYT
jgi:hypothetical protein